MIYYNHQIKVHVNILKAALTKGLQEKPFFLHTKCSRVHWGNNPFLYKGIIRNPWETYGNSKRRIYYEIKETGLAFECRNGNFHTGRMRQQLRIERSVRPAASKSASASTESSGTGNADEAEASKPITIDFWNSWTGSDGDTLVELVKQFNDENPWNITVNMDISSSFAEKLSTSLPTGDASPLILMGNGDRFKYQEYLLPINDIWTNTQLKEEDFNTNSLDTGRIEEDLYSLPFQNSLYYMYWNKDLFEKAGLDPEAPPQSFEEWTEMAAKITDPDSNVYGSGLFMAYGNQEMCLMQQMGGLAVEEQGDGTYKVNIAGNDGYKKYLEWMKALYTNGDNPQENEIDSMFKAGQIGIMVNGPWLAPGADESGVNFGMCKIFGQEPLGDVAGFFITSSATEEREACL